MNTKKEKFSFSLADTIDILVKNQKTILITKNMNIGEILKISEDRFNSFTKLGIFKKTGSNNCPLVLTSDEKAIIKFYCVYQHINKGGKVVYVGSGDPTRATDTDKHREAPHARFLVNELVNGRYPFKLFKTRLNKEEAEREEYFYLYKNGLPEFNTKGVPKKWIKIFKKEK